MFIDAFESGKTTLLLALLNKLPILSGSIQLDGVPVSLLPDEDITKVIGVLPQALGSTKGWTVRKLLDPHNLFPLAELQKALAAVDMLHLISSLPDALNTVICQDPHLIDASRTVPSKKWFFDAPGSTDPNTAIQRSPSQLFSRTLFDENALAVCAVVQFFPFPLYFFLSLSQRLNYGDLWLRDFA